MRALQYFFGEATRSLWRRRTAASLAILSITIAIFVLGAFLAAGGAASRLLDRLQQTAELSVYLADTITAAERAGVERVLAAAPGVSAREFVSREQAIARFARAFPELAAAARSLDENPLPASYEVRLDRTARHEESVHALAARLRELPGVSDVRYDQRWIERLHALERLVRGIGFGVALLLSLAAMLTVSSVVRLALQARRGEIEIMHLVGAPLAYIRGPFVAEGVLQGGIGAAMAVVLLWLGWVLVHGRIPTGVLPVDAGVIAFLPWTALLWLVLGGMAVGCFGGLLAARAAR